MSGFRYCTAVWDAATPCGGWQAAGHPLHGCGLHPTHTGDHECRCGAVTGRHEVLPAPQGPNLSEREFSPTGREPKVRQHGLA